MGTPSRAVPTPRPTGLQTSQDARFYAISSRFEPFSNRDKTLVVQFTVKHEQNIDCGGGYVKLFPAGLAQDDMHGDSEYNIMFGGSPELPEPPQSIPCPSATPQSSPHPQNLPIPPRASQNLPISPPAPHIPLIILMSSCNAQSSQNLPPPQTHPTKVSHVTRAP